MQATTLTKSRFKIALECPRKLVYTTDRRYANLNDTDEMLLAWAEVGHQVGALAKLMYPDGIEIAAPAIEDQIRETSRLLQQENVTLFEPTLRHGNLLVRADILVKQGTSIRLIEVKSKAGRPQEVLRALAPPIEDKWRPYVYDVAFQVMVLEGAHPEWTITPYLMIVDKTAVASIPGIGAQFPTTHQERRVVVTLRSGFDVTKQTPSLLTELEMTGPVRTILESPVETPTGDYRFDEFVAWLEAELAAGRDIPPMTGPHCRKCEYYCPPERIADDHRSGWAECFQARFGQPVTVPRTATIFGLHGRASLAALLEKARLALGDIDIADLKVKTRQGEITTSQRQALQVTEARGEGEPVHLEHESLREAFSALTYPLHFIDFETARPTLPFHEGLHPNDIVLFQFSQHTLTADGHLRHASQCLIAEPGADPSIAVVRALHQALGGDRGTVVHWAKHEATMLRELRPRIEACDEPDRDVLVGFIDDLIGSTPLPGRLADMERLVSKFAYFQGSNGRSSIKKVLPAVLAHSEWLKNRYDQPLYGTSEMPSLNFPEGWVWLRERYGAIVDPYELLEASRAYLGADSKNDRNEEQDDDSIANGGAAAVAYARLQGPDLGSDERDKLHSQLRRYCELDTLAMVMVFQALAADLITDAEGDHDAVDVR